MSSPAPRRSTDTLESPRSVISSNQYPFPQHDTSLRPVSKGYSANRRASTASSVASIGGVLDTSSQGRAKPIAESGDNGQYRCSCFSCAGGLDLLDSAIAISTLLQRPIVRTGLLPHSAGAGAHKPPSTKDIPPVVLTNIPHIEAAIFKPYIAQAGSLYDAFQRAKEGIEDGGAQLFRRPQPSLQMDDSADYFNRSPQTRSSNLPNSPVKDVNSLSPVSPLESPQFRRRTSGAPSRRAGFAVTPLATIPNVYFEENFHLENPRTFDIVSERSEIVRPPPGSNGSVGTPGYTGRKALATNAILQEKLSWYMDTVEIHLISSISTGSTSFFAALGSLRELHSEAAESVSKIRTLRQDLTKLDQGMAVGGLKIVSMRRRRENLRKLGDTIEQLREVVEAVAKCEQQVDNGDVETALTGLAEVQKLIAGERGSQSSLDDGKEISQQRRGLIDLRGIKALEGADNDIGTLRRRIGKGFESRFIEALLGDLRNHVDHVPPGTTIQRWDKASQRNRGHHTRVPSALPAYLQLDESLRSKLKSNLDGLARSDCLMPATVAYRDGILREIKTLIRRQLPSSSDDDTESTMSASTQGGRQMTQQERSSILARNLRSLDAGDAEDILKNIYANIGEALRRLGTQVKVLLDVTSSLQSAPGPVDLRSPSKGPNPRTTDGYFSGPANGSLGPPSIQQEEVQRALDLSSLLGQAVDIAQAQITKILKVRSEQTTHLTLLRFLRYFTLNRLFADECEAVTGRSGTALKTLVNSHIKDFVHQFADAERQRMVQSMDADRWDAKDFGDSENFLLARVLEGSTRDVEAWTKDYLIWEDGNNTENQQARNGALTNGNQITKDKVRSATIDEQKYILPESAMTALSGIENFEHLITGIPSMIQELTSSLLDYLKLFNSRSSQLILGAGATRSAGLKNITTKHLALASQALSFVIALIPHVREFVRRHSPPGSSTLTTEFDKLKRLYQDHQSGIHDKLVDIMSGRAATHVAAMKKIDWDAAFPSSAPQTATPYMETLVKETSTLHKVLAKHLPDPTVAAILLPVFASYRDLFGKAFAETEIATPRGKDKYGSLSLSRTKTPPTIHNRRGLPSPTTSTFPPPFPY